MFNFWYGFLFVHYFYASKSTKIMNILCQMIKLEFVSFNKPTVVWKKTPTMKLTTICFSRNLVQQRFLLNVIFWSVSLRFEGRLQNSKNSVLHKKNTFLETANIYNKANVDSKDSKLLKLWNPDQYWVRKGVKSSI